MSPSSSSQPEESLPLLSPQPQHSPTLRHKLSARRHVPLTEKAKGKQRAVEPDSEAQSLLDEDLEGVDEEIEKKEKKVERGRRITVIFSNEGKEGNLELWVEPDETVGKVKDQVSHHYPVQYQDKPELAGHLLMIDTPPPVDSHTPLPPPDPFRPTINRRNPPSPMAAISRRKITETSINNGRRRWISPQRSRINRR
jgi:hypothetical protein